MKPTSTPNCEREYQGSLINGFVMLGVELILIAAICFGFTLVNTASEDLGLTIVFSCAIIASLIIKGFFAQQPNESRVMIFFGEYRGTCRRVGFYWVNPFMSKRKLSLRIRNMDVEPLKVNDKVGNPVMIGMVLVWKVKDTYRAVFDVDAPAPIPTGNISDIKAAMNLHNDALSTFVRIQSDAALREVTGLFAYDNIDSAADANEVTLRSGGDEVNDLLEHKLNERLAMAGIEVVEARINYLAYAPEIAAVMLRRQQAAAIISAREKIVEGAVSMVQLALNRLAQEQVVELDEERKAAMVSNLLVVLCADEPAQPVVNTGTLYN